MADENSSGLGVGIIVGVIIIIAVAVLLMFVMPGLRGGGTTTVPQNDTGTDIEIPSQLDVNVEGNPAGGNPAQ